MESSPAADDPDQKVYVVLGCRRPGTSFLAEALGNAGVVFRTCGNGHNEDGVFCVLNDAVLGEAGGDWSELPPDDRIAEAVAAYETEYRSLIEERAQAGRWGWKDPRQGATIQYLNDQTHLKNV